jgi:hypothetical protein
MLILKQEEHVNKMKHLVITGCSFTQHNRPETWHHQILKNYKNNLKLHNVGIGGAGNYIISTLCINKVSELLSAGIKSEDIIVITQWSGVSRKSFIGDNRKDILSVDFRHCESQNSIKALSYNNINSKFCWDIGKKNNANYWINFKENYWSDECAFIETLENILRTQWFLKSSNINFLMFLGWDLFTDSTVGQYAHSSWKSWFRANDGRGQWDKKNKYINKNNQLLKDKFKWSEHLWNMIDMSKFKFFENDKIKLGGMMQWGQYNLSKEKWYCGPLDPHPSKYVHEGFFKNKISPWLNELM